MILQDLTLFTCGITTGRGMPGFVYTKWSPSVLTHLKPAFSKTLRSLLTGLATILGIS